MPRLVFLLGEDAEGPAALFGTWSHGARQERSGSGWLAAGLTTATVTSPDGLETALLQALTALPPGRGRRRMPGGAGVEHPAAVGGVHRPERAAGGAARRR